MANFPAMIVRLFTAITLLTALSAPSVAGEEPHRRLVIGGDCRACEFEGANLAGAHFLGGDFSAADFAGAELLGAHLSDLTLKGATFEGASLIDARLANVSFDGADLSDARLTRARLHRTRFQSARLERADLSGAVFHLSDFTGADLSDAEGADAVFRQTNLSGAELRAARLRQAHFFGARLNGADLRAARLNEAIFENSDLTGADFRGARLAGARFIAVNLTGADFRGAEGVGDAVFRHSCGAGVDGLTGEHALQPCSAVGARESVSSLSVDAERLERRRAEMERARAAVEHALAQIQAEAGLSRSVRAEMMEALHQGWEAAAEALAQSQVDAGQAGHAGRWTFEIRRQEVGEPMQVILEQAEAGQAPTVIVRAPQPPAPPVAEDGADRGTRSGFDDADATRPEN